MHWLLSFARYVVALCGFPLHHLLLILNNIIIIIVIINIIIFKCTFIIIMISHCCYSLTIIVCSLNETLKNQFENP